MADRVESGGRAPPAIYCASVSSNMRCVSVTVRRAPGYVSANVLWKPVFIGHRVVHHCGPLQVVPVSHSAGVAAPAQTVSVRRRPSMNTSIAATAQAAMTPVIGADE
jgi:hypothetical protein